MLNVKLTKQCENATTDKLHVNPPLIREEVSLIFRWLEVVHSLPPRMTSSRLKSGYEEVKVSAHPAPVETQAGEYEMIIPAFPWGWGEGGGTK